MTKAKAKTTAKKQTAPKMKSEAPKQETVSTPTGRDWMKIIRDGLTWLVVWTLFFCAVDGCRRVIQNGLPKIHFEWNEPEAKTSLGRWIVSERPALLKDDYAAVGTELRETARRLRAGELPAQNAASADTIARVQPVVSDPKVWREFISRMNTQIEGGNLERLAEQYEEAAGYFGIKAVQALIEAVEVNTDEESIDEVPAAACDSDCAVGDDGQNEVEDQPVSSGEDRGIVPANETADKGTGTADTGTGCENGQCRTGAQNYQQTAWPYYGWPVMWW